ncbi:hypothetical protein D7V96_08945 [bacterium D16-59]|nr:hypothetical protein D7V96_08945 [bacterium D16-59]
MRQAKQVCKEMLLGLAIWVAVIGVILTVIATHRFAAFFGVLAGGIVAAGIILYMYRHLDIALDLDAKYAQRHIQIAAFQRLFFMGAATAAAFVLSEYIHPAGVILSLLGIKVTALLNPVIHKYLT